MKCKRLLVVSKCQSMMQKNVSEMGGFGIEGLSECSTGGLWTLQREMETKLGRKTSFTSLLKILTCIFHRLESAICVHSSDRCYKHCWDEIYNSVYSADV